MWSLTIKLQISVFGCAAYICIVQLDSLTIDALQSRSARTDHACDCCTWHSSAAKTHCSHPALGPVNWSQAGVCWPAHTSLWPVHWAECWVAKRTAVEAPISSLAACLNSLASTNINITALVRPCRSNKRCRSSTQAATVNMLNFRTTRDPPVTASAIKTR